MEPVATGQAAKDYLTRTVTPTLLKGLTELCKKKPADPIVSCDFCSWCMQLLIIAKCENLASYASLR